MFPAEALTAALVNSSPLSGLISVFLAVCSPVITELSRTKLCYIQLRPGYHGDACSIHTIGRRVRTLPLLERDIIDGDVPLDPGAADALEYHLCDEMEHKQNKARLKSLFWTRHQLL